MRVCCGRSQPLLCRVGAAFGIVGSNDYTRYVAWSFPTIAAPPAMSQLKYDSFTYRDLTPAEQVKLVAAGLKGERYRYILATPIRNVVLQTKPWWGKPNVYRFDVPEGLLVDGSSNPFKFLAPKYYFDSKYAGEWMIHDYLYGTADPRLASMSFADKDRIFIKSGWRKAVLMGIRPLIEGYDFARSALGVPKRNHWGGDYGIAVANPGGAAEHRVPARDDTR